MNTKPTYKLMKDVVSADREIVLCSVEGRSAEQVPLSYSQEVSLGVTRKSGGAVVSSLDPAQNQRSARVNTKTGRTLRKGIQLYRLWFNFLKLALELESLGVSLVVKNPTVIKNLKNPHEPIPSEILAAAGHTGAGGRSGQASGHQAIFRCRQVCRVRVNSDQYQGWDLDQVLTRSFDDWWKTHSYLFEGFYPTVMNSAKDWVDDPNFVHLRIDKTAQWSDVQQFMKEELAGLIKEEGAPRYRISGKNPRVNVLQNNFNALILSIKGWTPKEICTSEKIYLRKTDEHFEASRTPGDRLTIKTSDGKPKYSATVAAQRNMGLHHLFEVCEGRFGKAPPTKNL